MGLAGKFVAEPRGHAGHVSTQHLLFQPFVSGHDFDEHGRDPFISSGTAFLVARFIFWFGPAHGLEFDPIRNARFKRRPCLDSSLCLAILGLLLFPAAVMD